jgi:Ca2+-transporting ATPase
MMAQSAWHAMEIDTVLKRLDTDRVQGLSEAAAADRLVQYGENELRKEQRKTAIALFANQFKSSLIIILLVATLLSALAGEALDAILITAIVVFCSFLGFIQEYRAERALDALQTMLSPSTSLLRDGARRDVLSRLVVPGDIVIFEAGSRVPADARLIEAHLLKCDEAPLTGESAPVSKAVHILPPDVPTNDRKNMLFAGTATTSGRGVAVVVATGMDTELGRIAAEVAVVETEKTPLEKRTAEIGKWLGIVAVAICLLVVGVSVAREAVTGHIDPGFIMRTVLFAVALAVAAVPEALAAIVTGVLAIGMHQMAKQNALVRKMSAVETLGCTTVICTDKTGTLTRGEMTVRRIFCGGKLLDVSGVGYAPQGELTFAASSASTPQASLGLLLRAMVLCNDASLTQQDGKWVIQGDPTEAALLVAAAKAGLDHSTVKQVHPRIGEIPFTSESKCMTTLHEIEDGKRVAFMKGAPEVVLGKCSRIFANDAVSDLNEQEKVRLLEINEELAGSALRVLAIAYKELAPFPSHDESDKEQNFILLGLAGMMDPPREEAAAAIRVCNQVGIKPVMITGDHELTARAVAKEIGIHRDGDLVLTGRDLAALADEELLKIVDRVTVYARVSPMDKLKIVRVWKARGEVVAMTGDGVNDAPALKRADIGIAMGITGTDVAREAADMVLSDDNFATIVRAIEYGRWIYDNIKKYLAYLIRCNISEVVFIGGVVLALGPKYLPLLPAAILYINLVTDGLPALALGIAPPDPDIMQRPPRNPKESVFSRDVKVFILLAMLIEIPFFYLLFFHQLGDLSRARTTVFFLFIVVELLMALNFRSLRYSIFKLPPHRWLLLAIASQVLLTAVLIQFPSIRRAFGIIQPSFSDFGILSGLDVLVFIAVLFLSMEVTKALFRRRAA